jgi:hypothetical protein
MTEGSVEDVPKGTVFFGAFLFVLMRISVHERLNLLKIKLL